MNFSIKNKIDRIVIQSETHFSEESILIFNSGFFTSFRMTMFKLNKGLNLLILFSLIILLINPISAQKEKESSLFQLVRVKYSGGGDWYNDPTGDVNMMKFLAQNTGIKVNPIYKYVDLSSDNLFMYPVLFLTGHGNINFSHQEARNLRAYLENGGFLFIDDDYGLDPYIRKEMKKVFPEQEMVELPFSHGIYNIHFKFPNGLPKIHKHDDKSPQGLGLFSNKRLCVFFSFESNLGDGWVDPDIYKDPEERRQQALKMGTNIIVWALTH